MRAWLAVFALLTAALPAAAQTLTVARQVEQANPLDPAALSGLAQVEVAVAFQTGHGPEQGRYSGPLLWAALGSAGAIPPGAAKTRLAHSVVVTGRDGYAVVVAFGEIDPEFEGKQVILATRQDDHPIGAGELRLIVPGDRHGGRAVHDVVRVEVR